MPYSDTERQKAYMRAYGKIRQVRDKERIALRKKKYNMAHPEIVKEQKQNNYQKNKDRILKNPKNKLYWYKKSAMKREIDFNLTTEEFNKLLFSNCHYCSAAEAMGVDRKNSSMGYFSYNVVPCCKTCNYMKNTQDYQSFIAQVKAISKNFE